MKIDWKAQVMTPSRCDEIQRHLFVLGLVSVCTFDSNLNFYVVLPPLYGIFQYIRQLEAFTIKHEISPRRKFRNVSTRLIM
jgi:hypothetical protein